MAIGVRASIEGGRFADWTGDMRTVLGAAVRAGVDAAGVGLQLELRQAFAKAGIARADRMIGRRTFPDRAAGSLAAAADVFSRGEAADRILDGFARGAVLVPHHGRFLAIPTQANYRKGKPVVTPAELVASRRSRVVPVRAGGGNRIWLLKIARRDVGRVNVGKGTRLDGTARVRNVNQVALGRGLRPTARAIKTGYLALFVLVRRARLPRVVDAPALAAKWADRIPDLIERALPREV